MIVDLETLAAGEQQAVFDLLAGVLAHAELGRMDIAGEHIELVRAQVALLGPAEQIGRVAEAPCPAKIERLVEVAADRP